MHLSFTLPPSLPPPHPPKPFPSPLFYLSPFSKVLFGTKLWKCFPWKCIHPLCQFMNHPVFDRRGVHSWQLAHITDWFPTLLTAAQQVEQLAAADRTSQTDSLLSS